KIKISDSVLFYTKAIPKNQTQVDIYDINEQYLAEIITALQAANNQMSADGERNSYVPSKSVVISKYMLHALAEDCRNNRGMEIDS
ncbi:SPFH domain-containing protein, partial [Enterococcus faecalis]